MIRAKHIDNFHMIFKGSLKHCWALIRSWPQQGYGGFILELGNSLGVLEALRGLYFKLLFKLTSHLVMALREPGILIN